MAKWRPVPLVDGSYADASKPFSSQDLINYYVEPAQSEGTRSATKLVGVPGLREFISFGAGPVRGMRNVEGALFVVSDTDMFQVNSATDVTQLGEITGRARVSMTHNQITNGNEVVIGTGAGGYVYSTVTQAFAQISDDGFPGFVVCDYINSLIIGIEPMRRFFFNSALAAATDYDSLERYESESCPDRLVTLIVSHGEVVVFNERTTEWFYNTADPTDIANHILFRNKQVPAEVGCASPHGAVNLDNAIFFIGSDGNGYELRGYTPRIITPPPISRAWQDCDISKAFCMVYEQDGHKFWYVTFPDGHTWGYDVSTGKWHRRQSKGLDRWRVNCVVRWKGPDDDTPQWYAGSYNSGMIWRIDPEYMMEGCEEHIRTFRTGVLHDEGNRVFTHGVRVEYDSGSEETVCAEVAAVTPSMSLLLSGTLADGTKAVAYSSSLTASRGQPPYVNWSISSGSLPPGLSISTTTGLITGTPT